MALVRVGTKHQVVIPKDVFSKLGLAAGDYVDVSVRKNEAVIKRNKIVDDFPVTDEAIGPKMRASLRRSRKEVAQGKVHGPYRSAEEVQAFLDGLKKKRR